MRVLLGVILLLWSGLAYGQANPWIPDHATLDNGMEIIVIEDHRVPVVSHVLYYKVGAVDEDPGKSGIAHLFEHLMFKATDELEDDEFSKIVARLGGQGNASTSQDWTNYYQRIAKQHLGRMMAMEADRMRDLQLTAGSVFTNERDAVEEERRLRIENNPGAVLFEKILAALYRDHPYGIPVIGFMDEVKALSVDDGLDFYAKWYAPNNAILVVAGDTTMAEVLPLAESTYGQVAAQPNIPQRKFAPVPDLESTTTLVHTDPKVRQRQWVRMYLNNADTKNMRTKIALNLATSTFGSGYTSKLYQSLVENQKIAIATGAFADTSSHDRGYLGFYVLPTADGDVHDAKAALLKEIDIMLENGLDGARFDRQKQGALADLIYVRDSQFSLARTFGEWRVRNGEMDGIAKQIDIIRDISLAEAETALRVLIEDQHYVDGFLIRDGETIPTQEDIAP